MAQRVPFKILLAANPAALAPGPLMATMGLASLIFAGFILAVLLVAGRAGSSRSCTQPTRARQVTHDQPPCDPRLLRTSKRMTG